MTGLIYFIVIVLSSILGAIVGLGGGVFVRPVFDALGYHSMLNVNFFASMAIVTMAFVSTAKKIKDGTRIKIKIAAFLAAGALIGGMLGDMLLQHLLSVFEYQHHVQYIQIAATVVTLSAALFLTRKNMPRFEIKSMWVKALFGLPLGLISTFLGIGGGPINVPLLMIFFGMNIKDATVYSIVLIFVSHASRLMSVGISPGFLYFDLNMLPYVITAAALGGLLGARLSKVFSESTVRRLFQATLCAVILLNVFNGVFVL